MSNADKKKSKDLEKLRNDLARAKEVKEMLQELAKQERGRRSDVGELLRDFQKAKELKEALAEEERQKGENPGVELSDGEILLYYKIGSIDGKLTWLPGWLAGVSAIGIGLLIPIVVAVLSESILS